MKGSRFLKGTEEAGATSYSYLLDGVGGTAPAKTGAEVIDLVNTLWHENHLISFEEPLANGDVANLGGLKKVRLYSMQCQVFVLLSE
jgi:hypothetical protein